MSTRQRANFPCVVGEVKASQVFCEDKGSSRIYLGNKWSANNLFMYHGFPGKARMGFNDDVFPSAWNESGKWGWESDFERDRNVQD